MILIFGGAYQGKLDYAVERFRLSEEDIYHCSEDDAQMPTGKKLIYELDKWILAMLKADACTASAVKRLIEDNKDVIIVCNDVSCGIVPIDPVMRAWREAVGRALAAIAGEACAVVRLFCGVATVIKSDGGLITDEC
ncbi:MAG: bifunctional adenosylcobinamide kinase/adenosylcobinamide-phosphate guanylyltransferase [Oscillospiraceae bacterium]|nr:bifunctional adenosylcobinamide kinase/adenosylcobinamide-phosphate guanylyltransferase [Oscillospiraceae bacterium]